MIFIFIFILVLFIVLTYLYLTWNHNYWNKLGIPHDKPSVLFGSIREIVGGTKHFGVHYKDLYNNFENVPYFGFYNIRSPGLILRDPELIKNVLVKDFASFSCYDFRVDPNVDPIWTHTVFSQDGDSWKKSRSAWSAAFTTSKLNGMHEEINKKCKNMIGFINKHSENHHNEGLEARELISKFFLDSILSSVMGIDFNSFEAKENPYKKIVDASSTSNFWEGMKILSFMFFPELAKIFNIRFVSKRVEEKILKLVKDILERRKMENDKKFNALESILEHYENKEFSEMQAAAILYTFLFEGVETSSGILAYMLYELSKDKKVQTKLRNEFDEAFDKNDYEKNMYSSHYLDMVISEILRIYPQALSTQRLCTKSYTFPPVNDDVKPFKIPAGMTVIIPVHGLHMDPKYFPDPEKFNPERFSEENKENIPKCAYLPFGEGPRTCIGYRLALNMTKIGIFHILKNFELRLTSDMVGKKMEIDPNYYITKTIGGLWITFHKRLNEV